MQLTRRRVPIARPSGPVTRLRTLPWLAARATFGYSTTLEAEIAQRGHDDWVLWQLDPDLIDDSALEQKIAAFPWVSMSALEIISDPTMNTVDLSNDYKGIRLLRAVESKRQLFERVCQFWEDHFNVFMGRYFRFVEDRTLWRRLALTNFSDLLKGVVTSASMIAYLDNDLNVVGAGNENLAREILELHTLGVDGPYDENDLREFARVLTGWTYDVDRLSPEFGNPLFDPSLHDFSPKTILGTVYDRGQGEDELLGILDMLAMHPSTIDFVVRKMARFFLGDNAPVAAVEEAKLVWVQSGGDLKKIFGELLSERNFEAVVVRNSTKFRRPFDWYASIFRSTGAPLPDVRVNYENLAMLGQAPFEWGPPDGYPEDRERWVGLVASRWNMGASFARPLSTEWAHSAFGLVLFVSGAPRSAWAERLNQRLTGGRMSRFDVAEIQAHIDSFPPNAFADDLAGEAFELALSSPSYQIV